MNLFGKDNKTQLEEALKKINTGDFKAGFDSLIRLAMKSEYPEAEYWVGDTFEFILNDCVNAAIWYSYAAAHGHVQSQFCYANLKYIGKGGVEIDNEIALSWYHHAAENNHPQAQFVLGEFYRTGLTSFLAQDTDRALYWYKQSSTNGYELAATRIEQFYPNGTYVERTRDASSEVSEEYKREQERLKNAMAPLKALLLAAAHEKGFIPTHEYPYIPELVPMRFQYISQICGRIKDKLIAEELSEHELDLICRHILLRAFDLAYLWRKSTDGKIGEILMRDPFDVEFTQLPQDLAGEVKQMASPQMISSIMWAWWNEHKSLLKSNNINLSVPVCEALGFSFDVGISVALKVFGYRK
jgi:hypothetical protein